LGFLKTVGVARDVAPMRAGGRPSVRANRPRQSRNVAVEARLPSDAVPVAAMEREAVPLEPLLREWLMELKVMGRAPRTIEWYEEKFHWFLRHGQAQCLHELTAYELKRYVAELQERGLADNTVHGHFEVLKAFGNWADREGYPVDPQLLRVRAPKVAQKEVATYSEAQLNAILGALQPGWSAMAVQVLLGTGMRVSELCALRLEDFEDDDEACFFKIQRGKGAKFRRVPVTQQLRRQVVRYLNRVRPDAKSDALLLRADGVPVRVVTVTDLFQRLRHKLGFPVHAHRFRHTFATEYLRRGGEIERLRRILGHTTYVMVMRYVHLDKGDLSRDFDLRSPY
jgi:integrase